MIFGLGKQDMNMVADGINFKERTIMIFENTGDVGMKLAALVIAQKLAAALGTEHQVNDDVGKGLGHEVTPLQG